MSQPSFWDRNPQYAHQLPAYLNEEQKQELVNSGSVFVITAVIAEPNAVYNKTPTPRWSLVIEAAMYGIDSGDSQRTMTFPMNPRRDVFMAALKEWLESGKAGPECVLGWFVPSGGGSGFYTINPASGVQVEPENRNPAEVSEELSRDSEIDPVTPSTAQK